MDAHTTARVKQEWAREFERFEAREHPLDFPVLPPIPPGRYKDARFFELENEYVWGKTWLFAGHVDELPEIGSYKLWRDSGAPIIIVRGQDGEIRAFYNTCQHRGGPLVKDASGKVSMLACKYHCWRYDLEGRLQTVPDEHEFPGLDKSKKSLMQVSCALWGNLIFVNHDPQAQPLDDFLGALKREFGDLQMDSRKVFATCHYEIKANWKAAVDTFQEVYHIKQVHPRTINAYLDYTAAVFTLYDNGHSRLILPLKQTEEAKAAQVLDAGGRTEMNPEHEITRSGNRSYTVFPNIVTPAAEFQFPFLVFWPTGIDTCRMDVIFMAPEGHADPESPECQQLVAAFGAVMEEDLSIMNYVQESMQTPAFRAIELGYTERRIYQHHEMVDRCIGADNLPPALAVKQVLQAFVENW